MSHLQSSMRAHADARIAEWKDRITVGYTPTGTAFRFIKGANRSVGGGAAVVADGVLLTGSAAMDS
eukprot:15360703-Alexandrium_andersonii.AAC.1